MSFAEFLPKIFLLKFGEERKELEIPSETQSS